MKTPIISVEHGQKKEESWHELYPEDEYRQPDEQAGATVERKLYPLNRYRSQEDIDKQLDEKQLYPRDALRSPDYRAGHQIERVLWSETND